MYPRTPRPASSSEPHETDISEINLNTLASRLFRPLAVAARALARLLRG